MFKKLFSFLLITAAVVAAALVVIDREERRLIALYRQVEERLHLKKNTMTVDF